MAKHIGLFQIPFMQLYALSVEEIILPGVYDFSFRLINTDSKNHYFSEKHATPNSTHGQDTTNHKVHESDLSKEEIAL